MSTTECVCEHSNFSNISLAGTQLVPDDVSSGRGRGMFRLCLQVSGCSAMYLLLLGATRSDT
eukprot:1675253-Amphidinium_carterae.1